MPKKPATTYEIIFENQPVTEGHMASMASSSDHFQYYYQVIAKPKTEWFEFKLAAPGVIAASDSNLFRVISANHVSAPARSPAPDPATCGLLGLLKRLVGLK